MKGLKLIQLHPKKREETVYSAGFERFFSGHRSKSLSGKAHLWTFFSLRMNPDSLQQLNACTSCAGGDPGPDSSLARGRTTSSRLLHLHHDDVCLEIQGWGALGSLWKQCNCHSSWLQKSRLNPVQLVRKKSQRGWCRENQRMNQRQKRFKDAVRWICRGENVWPPHLLGVCLCSDPAAWFDSQTKFLRVKGQAADSLVIY